VSLERSGAGANDLVAGAKHVTVVMIRADQDGFNIAPRRLLPLAAEKIPAAALRRPANKLGPIRRSAAFPRLLCPLKERSKT
jgi:hypothetical protein